MINWKYVKGLNQSNGANSLYSFLIFESSQTDNQSFAAVPELKYNTVNNATSANNWGHIITQLATGQSIDTEFTFNNYLNINKRITIKTGEVIYLNSNRSKGIYYNSSDDRIMLNSHSKINGKLDIEGALKVTTGGISVVGGYCEALYFNATSDRRAKTNIKSLDFDALDLIKKVQLYSFTYKDTDTKSIGVIAQDLQSISLDGFKLVDNEDASGKDMDYMTVHESKLVYILWKAIQEQQKEIEELKAKLK